MYMKAQRTPKQLWLGLLLLSCAWLPAPASSQEYAPSAPDSIVLRTDVTWHLEGAGALPFSPEQQTAFAAALRSALTAFNFMSVATSSFQAGSSGVDVVTRLVTYPIDGQSASQQWQAFGYEALVTNQLPPLVQANMTASGLQAQPSIVTAAGIPDANQPQIGLQLNMTLAGQEVLPFSGSKQDSLTTVLRQFLGEHASGVTLSGYAGDASQADAVAVQYALQMDPAELPQLWLFLYNSTQLQSALSTITPAANLTILGALVSSQAPAPMSAPVAPPPASSTPAATPESPTKAGTIDTVTSVTIDLGMRIAGSRMLPFDSPVQFASASSMAAVFSIIIGTGAVQILSFSPVNGSTPVVATGGRRLQQASSSSSSPSVDVVFAVSLPEASQNSLLVTQSTNPTVRSQFAGWFVSQMQARGYDVNATVQSISLAAAAQAQAPAANPSTPAAQTPVPSGSSSSSHVGAIVGGVVGGVAALTLVALLAVLLFMLRRSKRPKKHAPASKSSKRYSADVDQMSPRATSAAATRASSLYSGSSDFRPGKRDHLEPTHLRPFPALLTPSSQDSRNAATRGTTSTDSIVETATSDDLKRILQRQRQPLLNTGSPLTSTSETPSEQLDRLLAPLTPGSVFMDKYVLQEGRLVNNFSVLAFAHTRSQPRRQVAIKFCAQREHFAHEKLFYDNRAALEGVPATKHVAELVDAIDGVATGLPPALVFECGDFTLQDWCDGVAKLAGRPGDADRKRILYEACLALEYLHLRSIVHGDFGPRSVMWFPDCIAWKLVALDRWARSGEQAPPAPCDIRTAPPEHLAAELAQERAVEMHGASDMWGLGLIAFELLTGKRVFPDDLPDEQVLAMLVGLQPLPWEADPRFFAKCLDPSAAAFVGDLLMRSPDARKPIRTIIHAPMFEPVLSDLAFDTNLASASGRSLSLNLASASSRDLDAGRA